MVFLEKKNQYFCFAFRGEHTEGHRSSIPFPRSEKVEKLEFAVRSVPPVLVPSNIWPIKAQARGHSELLVCAPHAPLQTPLLLSGATTSL